MKLVLDLQLFAEEKTEPATPRRRALAREKGQIASSQNLSSALAFMGSILALKVSFDYVASFLLERSREMWAGLSGHEATVGWGLASFREVLITSGASCLPVMLCSMLAGVAASLCQTGFLARPSALTPDFSRLNPVSGLSRVFSRRALVHCATALVKVGIMAGVSWSILRKSWPELSSLCIRQVGESVTVTGTCINQLATSGAAFMVLMGLVDYVYQWWELEKSLRMSKKEMRDEMRDTEVKPEVRSQIRARHRQMARTRMMDDVPSADVIVTNPNHYAVALRYEAGRDPAPIVVAKGVNEVAQRIKEIGQSSSVKIVEDPPLARNLYRLVDVGDVIPEELYTAVAEVLAYVYRLSGRIPEEGGNP